LLTCLTQIVWDTTKFNNKADWPTDGSQPFYLSTGDNTGYSQHADYVFGWKGDALQKAMDTNGCMGATCASLKQTTNDAAAKCSVPRRYLEDYDGCKSYYLPYAYEPTTDIVLGLPTLPGDPNGMKK
jgi:hypothetical protein